MKKRFFAYTTLFAALFLMLTAAGCNNGVAEDDDDGSGGVQMGAGDRTFYVSMSEGNDSNDGLSQAKPIKTLTKVNSILLGPNDQVLFKRNDAWFCADESTPTALVPWGRGLEGRPVTIGAYGTGNPPLIAGSGREEAIRIQKTEYMRVQDLEITNDDARGYLDNPNLKGARVRRGVYVMPEHIDYRPKETYARRDTRGRTLPAYGAMRGIELVNLEIHDVLGYAMHANDFGFQSSGGLGNDVGRWWNSGGILFKNGSQDYNGDAMSRVNLGLAMGHSVDPLVKDCYIHDVTCTAIYADNSPGRWDPKLGDDGLDFTDTGLRVEGTVIRNTGSEGIALTNAFWNFTVDRCGIYDLGYIAQKGNGWFLGALYAGNNSVFQNCEVARMMATGDSHAWDNDIGCWGVGLIQYNYVRDMPGSFLMNWGGADGGESGTIIRYNVSINVGGWSASGGPVFRMSTNSNTYIYNNVFYNDKGAPIRFSGGNLDHAACVNNVFWSSGAVVLGLNQWKSNQDDSPNPIYFDNNAYYNPGGTVVTSSTDYPNRVITANGGAGWKDDNKVILTSDPFGKVSGTTAPGGAGTEETMSSPGYAFQIFGTPVRDKNEIAKHFLINAASDLYQAGRAVTRQEVDDFIWGRITSTIPNTLPHASTERRGNRNIFNRDAGQDFFGNPIPDPVTSDVMPSIGVHNP